MFLAAVNYPTFDKQDFEWIQTIRKEHDNLYYKVVDPHFTLVFPTEGIDEFTLIEHVKHQLTMFKSFEVFIRCATVGDPDFQDHAHVFLIPDEGFSKIVKLHDQLYTGPLRSELRLDLPFVPHIGIANAPEPEVCKEIVDELNAQNFEIRGKVESIDIIRYDGKKVWTIEKLVI